MRTITTEGLSGDLLHLALRHRLRVAGVEGCGPFY